MSYDHPYDGPTISTVLVAHTEAQPLSMSADQAPWRSGLHVNPGRRRQQLENRAVATPEYAQGNRPPNSDQTAHVSVGASWDLVTSYNCDCKPTPAGSCFEHLF